MPKNFNNAKVTQRLVEAFQLKGRYLPLLDEVIVPVYVMDDPAPAQPNRLAAGTIRIDGVISPQVDIFNPVGSGMMIVLTSAVATLGKSGAAFQGTLNVHIREAGIIGDASDVNSLTWRDNRITPTIPTPQAEMAAAFGVGSIGIIIAQRPFSISGVIDPQALDVISAPLMGPRQPPVVLRPGTSININSDTAAIPVNLVVNWLWEEIPLLGSAGLVSGTPP